MSNSFFYSVSSPIEDLRVMSIKSNLVVLNWKHPCAPNGKIAFFHSTLVGERVGHHNHIFSIKFDISVRLCRVPYFFTTSMVHNIGNKNKNDFLGKRNRIHLQSDQLTARIQISVHDSSDNVQRGNRRPR